MMEEGDRGLFEVIRERRSIRYFTDQSVKPEVLQKLLEGVRAAPSAGNLQAYEIFVVTDRKLLITLSKAAGNQPQVAEAPVVLVFCADPHRCAKVFGSRGEQLLCIQDATVACAYAQLAATALGLGSIWIGALLESEAVQEALHLPGTLWPIALLPIGYPAQVPKPKPRRSLSDLVRRLSSAL